MRAFAASLLLLSAVTGTGCGSSAKGPANPEETPVVTQEEVQEAYTKGMPPEVKRMYDQRYKK